MVEKYDVLFYNAPLVCKRIHMQNDTVKEYTCTSTVLMELVVNACTVELDTVLLDDELSLYMSTAAANVLQEHIAASQYKYEYMHVRYFS